VINVEHWAEIRRLHMSEHMGVNVPRQALWQGPLLVGLTC